MTEEKNRTDYRAKAAVVLARLLCNDSLLEIGIGGLLVREGQDYRRLSYNAAEIPDHVYISLQVPQHFIPRTEELALLTQRKLGKIKRGMIGTKGDFDVTYNEDGKIFVSLDPVLEDPKIFAKVFATVARRKFLFSAASTLISGGLAWDGVRRLRDEEGGVGQKIGGGVETTVAAAGLVSGAIDGYGRVIHRMVKNKHPDFKVDDSAEHWDMFETNVYRQLGIERPRPQKDSPAL